MNKRRVLFTVTQVINGVGSSHMEVDWHPDLYEVLGEDGKTTDKVIDIAEDIVADEAELDAEDGEERPALTLFCTYHGDLSEALDNAIMSLIEQHGGDVGDTGWGLDERDIVGLFGIVLPVETQKEISQKLLELGCAYCHWDDGSEPAEAMS